MAITPKTKNTFSRMNRDQLHSLTDQSTYQFALNAVLRNRDQRGVFSNEEGNKLVGGDGSIAGMLHLDEKNSTLFFKQGGDITLFNHDNNSEKHVFNASEFGCNFNLGGCEWHDIEAKVQGIDCQETIVYFTSKCEYYWFNLDEMLDPKRKNGLKQKLQDTDCQACTTGCDYFKVFQCACAPKVNAQAFSVGGGRLPAGAYQFVARLINQDGGETNWFHITDPVYVGSENNAPGERGRGRIEIQLSALDCRYSKIELAVIDRTTNTAKLINTFNYSQEQFSYTYLGDEGLPIDISEILLKGKTYLQGKYLEQRDGRMFYYGIRPRKNLNYQYLANQIKTEWVEYEIPLAQAKKLNVRTFVRGEAYAFGIVFHYKDGTSSPVFHIPGVPGSGNSDVKNTSGSNRPATQGGIQGPVESEGISGVPTSGSGATQSSNSTYTISPDTGKIERTRTHKEDDSINEPQLDEYDDVVEEMVDAYNASIDDVCKFVSCDATAENALCCQCSGGEECGDDCMTAIEVCSEDLPKAEEIGARWAGILADFGLDELSPTNFTPSNIKEAAQAIVESIQKRERIVRTGREYSVSNNPGSYTQGDQTNSVITPDGTKKGSIRADGYHDAYGNSESEVKFTQTNVYGTRPKIEKGLTYPCTIDCNGNPIYGSLKGSEVAHHLTPETCQSPFYVSNSVGVPSVMTPDADEYSDGYIRPLGVRFSSIVIPDIEETSIPLCDRNPYSIVMVKRTDKNKRVKLKGVAFPTFKGVNNGKTYDVPRHGACSPETVNAYLDAGGDYPRLSDEGDGDSHVVFSLDGCSAQPNLQGTRLKHELNLKGKGFKHGQQAIGQEPDDSIKGSRKDQLGTRQAINLNQYTPASCSLIDIDFNIYAGADETIAPPAGNSGSALLNKGQQEAIWVKSALPQKKDSSFVGIVRDHSTPIANAEGDYVAFVEEKDIQYGELTNLAYIPILHAGPNSSSGVIEGLGGDAFIGPWSFVRTSYVSDRVGSCKEDKKFDIPAKVDTKSQKRCICDDPEDAIHSLAGQWVWTKMPEDGDLADPKNWAGTHSPNESDTLSWEEAGGANDISDPPTTDYYYPRTLKTLFTVWVESEVNPYMLQRGDALQDQRYPNLKYEYTLDSGTDIQGGGDWENSYLNLYYYLVRQPSRWAVALKAFIKTTLNVLFPMLGIDNLLDITNGADIVPNLVEFPVLAALWYLLTQVLYKNDYVDKLLGIPVCKSDDVSGKSDRRVEKFFTNYCQYNWDYSVQNDIQVHYAMGDPWYTCDCLHEDTEVLMADHTRRKIKDIKSGELVKSFDTQSREYVDKKVLNVWDRGVLDLYEIKLSNRESVLASINHRWFVQRRYKKDDGTPYEIEIVTTRDLIEYPKKWFILFSNNISDLKEKPVSEDEAYLLGMYIAEGSIPSKKAGKGIRNKKYTEKFFISQFKQHRRDKIKTTLDRTDILYSEHKDGFYLRDCKNLYKFLLKVPKRAENKLIPEEVFKWDKSLLEKVFEGLMDGDGYVAPSKVVNTKSRGVVSMSPIYFYYTCSKQLVEDVKLLSWIIGKPMYKYNRGKISGFGSDRDQFVLRWSDSAKSRLGRGALYIKEINKWGKDRALDIEVEDTKSFILSATGAISHNCDDCIDGETTNDIYFSDVQRQNDRLDSYRTVRPKSYRSVKGHHGKLTELYSNGGSFWAATTEGYGQLRIANTAITSNIGDVILGRGDLLTEPVFHNEGMPEGMAGLKNKNHAINTQFGRFWVDEDSCKVYRQLGSKVSEISDKDMSNFLRENLRFCSKTSCKNQNVAGTSYYTLGVDPKYGRLLITKSDGNPEGNFTISYDLETGSWVSFHSYIPRKYLWDRKTMYSLSSNGLWQHNIQGIYQTYYGQYYPHIIEFASVPQDVRSFAFVSGFLNTEAEQIQDNYKIEDIDVTYNKMAAYNSTQSSGILNIKVEGDNLGEGLNLKENIEEQAGSIRFHKRNRIWQFNELEDLVDYDECATGIPMVRTSPCNPFYEVNQGIINCEVVQKQNYKNKVLADKYMIYRYIFDKSNKISLNTIYAETHGSEIR